MVDLKISIITICKDVEAEIERTLKSVVTQSYGNIEYIVVDGASSDNTCEVIRQYEDKISYFLSEPDTGIYNAMNKGVAKATGDFVFFINAGDTLLNSDVIKLAIDKINSFNGRDIDVFHGKIICYFDDTGDGYLWKSGPYNRFAAYRGCLPHQATFYLRKAFQKNGLFDESYRIAGDYEWLVRGLIKKHLKFQYIEILTAFFYKGGISNNPEYQTDHKKEIHKLISKNYTSVQRVMFSVLNRIRKIIGA